VRRGSLQVRWWPLFISSSNDGILDIIADPFRQILEVVECVSIAGDKITVAVLDVGKRTEAINLQLEDVVVGVERLGTPGKCVFRRNPRAIPTQDRQAFRGKADSSRSVATLGR
jgi:hypothetical protein